MHCPADTSRISGIPSATSGAPRRALAPTEESNRAATAQEGDTKKKAEAHGKKMQVEARDGAGMKASGTRAEETQRKSVPGAGRT